MAKQCKQIVYVRDTFRYSGRGRDGFSMHYARSQCKRYVRPDADYCWQHQPADSAPTAAEPERE